MNVLLVKPNEYAVEAEIENSLKALQKAVEGHIEVFTPGSDPVVYVLNEEGKVLGLGENRALYDSRAISLILPPEHFWSVVLTVMILPAYLPN